MSTHVEHSIETDPTVIPTMEEKGAEMDKAAEETTVVPDSTETASASSERPEYLPEKFDSPEDLAKAYKELEAKLGGEKEPEREDGLGLESKEKESTEESTPDATTQQEAINVAAEQFFADGELNEASYKSLADQGISKELADQFAQGQEAMKQLNAVNQEQATKQVYDSVGGEAEYKAMADWARTALPKSEQEAYTKLVNSDDVDTIKLAVSGLHSKYVSENGSAPKTQVNGMQATSGVTPFANKLEMQAAMADKQYKSNPAFRKSVIDKLAVSTF
jgi:hypothetical protein